MTTLKHTTEQPTPRTCTDKLRMGQCLPVTCIPAFACNHPIQKIEGKGQVTKYQLDDANRVDLATYFDNIASTIAAKSVSLTYDVLNNLTGYDDGISSAIYTFDDLQRKTSETINYGSFTKTISTGYYKNGRKKTYTDPSGVISSYSYDAENRLSQINLPGEGNITYNQYQWAAIKGVNKRGQTQIKLQ